MPSPTPAHPIPLADAIAEHVHDGDTVALEGFTHLIPFAAAHEIARQGRRHLTLVRMTPDLVYDQLIGLGVADELVFSYGGNPGVGSLHRLRDAVEHHWPHQLAVREHSHAGLANAYVAGAARLPFAVLRGYRGTDLEEQRDIISGVTCPFTGEELAAVKAINPDVTVIHAQLADRDGNVMLWGITGVQREAVLAADRAIVTVEEVVDEFPERTGAVILPNWVLSAVCVVPNGAWPSYAAGYSVRDNDFYQRWDAIARNRTAFLAWAAENDLKPATDSEPADDPRVGDARVNDAGAGDPRADEARVDEARTDEARADEARTDEARADEARTDEARADEANVNDARAGDASVGDASPSDAQVDDVKEPADA